MNPVLAFRAPELFGVIFNSDRAIQVRVFASGIVFFENTLSKSLHFRVLFCTELTDYAGKGLIKWRTRREAAIPY